MMLNLFEMERLFRGVDSSYYGVVKRLDGDDYIVEVPLAGISRDVMEVYIESGEVLVISYRDRDDRERDIRFDVSGIVSSYDLDNVRCSFKDGLLVVRAPPKKKKRQRVVID